MGCGAEAEALSLMNLLTQDLNFEIPDIDLNNPNFQLPGNSTTSGMYLPIARLTNSDLAATPIGGEATFNRIMQSIKAHLTEEYEKGRITGGDYTKAYIALTEAALGNAVQFLLGRDEAFWKSQLAQVQAITARVGLETAKLEAAKVQFEALNAKATYALTSMKLSSESMAYCLSKYQLDNLLPKQVQLTQEQIETARSQTLNTRTDGATIVGSIGKQKDLYSQQIDSYKRDAETKTARLFTDAWITMKTIDEGLLPPTGFTNSSLDTVLAKLKVNNGLT